MNIEKQIIQLYDARKLSSDEEYSLFEEALENLQGNIKIDDVYEICKVFFDDTEDYEVMFGMIHLIEQLQGQEYLKCIAICSPNMVEAHDWAMTLNKRIINSKKYYDDYINVINSLDNCYKEKILKMLIDVKNDNKKRFGQKVDFIFQQLK